MINTIINETNQLREKYNPELKNLDNKLLIKLAREIGSKKYLQHHEGVHYFLNDIEEMLTTKQITLKNTKSYINTHDSNFIFSMFNVPYSPSMGIESIFYEKLLIHPYLENYKTNVMPVNITAESAGFNPLSIVALFPENHIDGKQDSGDKIFYFINKFVKRYHIFTHKTINNFVDPGQLQILRKADNRQIEEACVFWVWLHEYNHQHGFLPIPQYLQLKSKKVLAGLEELRVDLASMIICLENRESLGKMAELVFEFIFAERLLRYGIEGVPIPTYDALSSYIFFNYLNAHHGIILKDNIIQLSPDLPKVLRELLDEINYIESLIITSSQTSVQKQLINFANRWLYTYLHEYNSVTNYYRFIKESLIIKGEISF